MYESLFVGKEEISGCVGLRFLYLPVFITSVFAINGEVAQAILFVADIWSCYGWVRNACLCHIACRRKQLCVCALDGISLFASILESKSWSHL